MKLFFKWIKQNVKIKSFWGTSVNAVFTQIWAALILSIITVDMSDPGWDTGHKP
ncbi:hypothetical protein Holit_02969 [Hollandina sp. SP2]